MAIRFDAAGEGLSRSANLPSATAFTLCGWFKIVGGGAGSNEYLCAIADTGGSDSLVFYTRIGGTYGVQLFSPAVGSPVSAGSISTGQWYFGALSCAGTGATDAKARFAALGATTFSSASVPGVAFTPTTLAFGDTLGYGQWANAAVAGWKLFDRALTDAELLAEMYRLTPASTTNLNLWTPMVHNSVANSVKDFGGNGRDWTAVGTLSVEDGPPVGWGAPVLVVGQSAASGSTGTLAATETGDDAAVIAGSVLAQGTLAATESGSDVAAIEGVTVNVATGSLAATESGSDTAEIVGVVLARGTLAANDSGEDTAAITGVALVSGTLDATEAGSDTAVIAAVALVQGSLDATESGIDTAAIEGSLAVISTGSLAATESGSDTATFDGVAPVSGALAATEAANDSAAVSGVVLVTGALDATETGSDTAAFASSTPVTTAYPGPAGRATKGKRRRVVIRERVYEVNERDIPALLEAELLDRAPPVTAEVVEGPKPPRKRGKKAPQPVKTVEQVREAVQQIKARIEPDNAWLAQALEAVAFRVLERLQDEEDTLMLLLAA